MIESLHSWIAVALGVAVFGLMRDAPRRLRGSTMIAPWAWSVAAVVALTAVEAMAGLQPSGAADWIAPARFAAACLTFCPSVAILGAKRPQDSAWQLIVLALLVVLAMPAVEAWLRGTAMEVHVVRGTFLAILVFVGWFNYLPTRFAAAATAYAAAQTALFWPHFPLVTTVHSSRLGLIGLGLLLLGALLLRTRGTAVVGKRNGPLAELASVWREFRDWYGAVWSLRVMERMNASSSMYGWPVTLAWEGFARRGADGSNAMGRELTANQREAIAQALRSLLRRFVSVEWINARVSSLSDERDDPSRQE
jgi:hypothetical protein